MKQPNEQLQQLTAVTAQQHQNWLQQPIAQDVIKILQSQEKLIVDAIENRGSLIGASEDSVKIKDNLLQLATQLKTVRSVSKLLLNTEAFVSKLHPTIITNVEV